MQPDMQFQNMQKFLEAFLLYEFQGYKPKLKKNPLKVLVFFSVAKPHHFYVALAPGKKC
jgi:hypothetical protein